MSANNRRKSDRLRIDRSVRISVQIFPVMPFLGEPVEAILSNISPGGMALTVKDDRYENELKKGRQIRIHVRMPGSAIEECRGTVTHSYINRSAHVLGVRFTKISSELLKELQHMSKDNAACDTRIASGDNAWCLPTCSFYALCRKPLRLTDENTPATDLLEISFQHAD